MTTIETSARACTSSRWSAMTSTVQRCSVSVVASQRSLIRKRVELAAQDLVHVLVHVESSERQVDLLEHLPLLGAVVHPLRLDEPVDGRRGVDLGDVEVLAAPAGRVLDDRAVVAEEVHLPEVVAAAAEAGVVLEPGLVPRVVDHEDGAARVPGLVREEELRLRRRWRPGAG